MIHVVAMKCLIFLPLLMHIEFYEGVGVGVGFGVLKIKESESEVLKIGESESELLCTDSTALVVLQNANHTTTLYTLPSISRTHEQ
jgi:hypothetical protein